ncbi:protein MBD-R2-like isoform X2 [Ciona intestinalis]
MENNQDGCDLTSPVPNKKFKGGNYHCCVPICTGDSRYNTSLSFHRMPKDEQMRKQWVVKIRRDVGPNFKITSKTRVCSKHFKEEDFRPPDNSGRRLLKEGTLPSVFDWTATTNTRRKVLRHDVCESGTQTDESDMEADDASNQPPKSNQAQSICEELQQTKAQLAAMQAN